MRERFRFGPLTYAILALFTAFWGVEIAAHVTSYSVGATLSAGLWALERRFGWPIRVLIGIACAILFTHLEFQLP